MYEYVRPFDGCSLESWTSTFEGPGCFAQNGDASKWKYVPASETSWIGRVNSLIDAAGYNLSVAAMTGSAGCQSPTQTFISTADREKLDMLHYASYLMAVARAGKAKTSTGSSDGNSGGILVGTTAWFAQKTNSRTTAAYGGGLSYGAVWEPYSWDLGSPLSHHSNVTGFNVSPAGTPSVYVRYFEKAVVLVCPGNVSAVHPVALTGGPYVDRMRHRQGIIKVTMSAQTGLILMKQQQENEDGRRQEQEQEQEQEQVQVQGQQQFI